MNAEQMPEYNRPVRFESIHAARDANDCNSNAIRSRGALGSFKPDDIRFVESISDVISDGVIKTVLAA
jgi:hypothetical protein